MEIERNMKVSEILIKKLGQDGVAAPQCSTWHKRNFKARRSTKRDDDTPYHPDAAAWAHGSLTGRVAPDVAPRRHSQWSNGIGPV